MPHQPLPGQDLLSHAAAPEHAGPATAAAPLPPSVPLPAAHAGGRRRVVRPYYRFMRLLAQGAFVLYFQGRAFGRENVPPTGGVLLACTHQSFFDPITATCALSREGNYMARDTLFLNPLFARLIGSLNAFPVKRGMGDVGAVKETLRRLKEGKMVVVFPEGTRTRDGSIGRINANSMAVAKKAGAAIVPTVIDGAFEAWPRTRLAPSPARVYVTYAPALLPEQMRSLSGEEIAAVVEERLRAALSRSRKMRAQADPLGWLKPAAGRSVAIAHGSVSPSTVSED